MQRRATRSFAPIASQHAVYESRILARLIPCSADHYVVESLDCVRHPSIGEPG